jgi:transcriptional regulator with XRE-family HTH domain
MDELGIGQAQLADDAGVSRSRLNELLRKDRLPACDFLIVIAKRLGISIDYLLGQEQETGLESMLGRESTQRLMTAFSALNQDSRERAFTMLEEFAKIEDRNRSDSGQVG